MQKVEEREKAIEMKKTAKKGSMESFTNIEKLDIDYIPIDFDAYSILPADAVEKSEEAIA